MIDRSLLGGSFRLSSAAVRAAFPGRRSTPDPRRSEGRGVAEIELRELLGGDAGLEGGGDNVDAFGHALGSDHLRVEQPARGAIINASDRPNLRQQLSQSG